MDDDTIVALSTPPGDSGLAVVRISGPRAVDILETLAPGAGRRASHSIAPAIIRDAAGEPIDEAMTAVMRAPASYTGEDVVEISCHGSMRVVGDLLEEILRLGGRLASPGEFTKRAFLNGKMDLAQAEAVADLISSETKLQRRIAFEQLDGALSRRVRELEESLLEQLALIETSIDFSEEDVSVYSPAGTKDAAKEMRGDIARLLESESAGGKLRRGIRITIVGARNVGKSSLYNVLLGEERAIVSPIPGTTRDILRERIHIGGFTCHLEDTAGIAETLCAIETRGIEIGRAAALDADLVLFVLDGNEGITQDIAREIRRIDASRLLCVLNKRDLGLAKTPAEARIILGVEDVIAVSALTGEGLDVLRERIYDKSVRREAGELARERIAVNARQAAALREADQALERLTSLIDDGAQAEVLSVEVRGAMNALGKITGRSIAEGLLETIFNRFCIGK
jgi:tRNA modification GTPase